MYWLHVFSIKMWFYNNKEWNSIDSIEFTESLSHTFSRRPETLTNDMLDRSLGNLKCQLESISLMTKMH